MRKLVAGCLSWMRLIFLRSLGTELHDVVQHKKPTGGSLDVWGWRDFKALPVSWFDWLAVVLSRVELDGVFGHDSEG